ncbi:MAG: hypothetical protein A3J10_02135 [Candidatus Sungbacteria bacterium RIFCSPLOWO2_02_FULL_54_10]|uniref:Penicillin-binding protein transpeptidase domain-containing protein n=2 Tax=Candidatus Sungiibacteriota TaxID=1817917 RepID=A0A1G2KUH2_9BACT|nr:MAG: hypothetical protein A3C92_01445 [Candidatus Sungbacteria bacterium RIFCSPHIGHO2_02_FULL_53_17]OHA12437.1 MAG: hypothetical protein A3J10_02135 [Candidatus Sungbacteria bacterium RIFCSPLOWO2_02_FULL_54_10]
MKSSFARTLEGRMRFILLFFLAACVVLLGRLFQMSIIQHQEYARLASRQHSITKELSSERGVIFAVDKSGGEIPLAFNKTYKAMVASPRIIQDADATAALIVESFGLDKEEISEKLGKKDDPYEILARKIEPNTANAFLAKKVVGISFDDEVRRVYPNGRMASTILGFTGGDPGDPKGQYGLERFLNDELSGTKGVFKGAKDASGFVIALGRRLFHPPKNGSAVTLTVDYHIQQKAEDVLKATRDKWGGTSGLILVMDPTTGRILAQATAPGFDPNAYSKERDYTVFLNPAVESSYELGSVLKPVTMAAAIEEDLVTPASTYRDTGQVKIGGYTIRNFDEQAYGVQTMSQVIEKSLNTGLVHVARLLGHERQLTYLKKFGFGEKTNVDMPGEVGGNISNLEAGRDIDFATASFGQGIAVTPLQMARAIAAIANDGTMMRPYIVHKITDDSGNEAVTQPEAVRNVITKETAEQLQKMLVSAVRSGFENRAKIPGYFVAGKTGTAQVPSKDGKGYSDAVTHTFVGFAPAFEPRFLILLQLNEPTGNRFAANTLTPAFHDLATFILNYYEIPPDEK